VGAGGGHSPAQTLVSRPALLQWITPHELEALRDALVRGRLPPDFLGKLKRLKDGDLTHHFIEQNCRLFAALLAATEDGNFREGSPAERERMLRVLAYDSRLQAGGLCGRPAGNARRHGRTRRPDPSVQGVAASPSSARDVVGARSQCSTIATLILGVSISDLLPRWCGC